MQQRLCRWALAAWLIMGAGLVAGQMTPSQTPAPKTAEEIQREGSAQKRKAVDPPLQIFDESQAARINPIRDAAERLLREELAQFNPAYAQSAPLISYQFDMEGTDEAQLIGDARLMALQAAAARLYFDEYYLVGRDLLRNYIAANGGPFVVQTEVLERRILADNQLAMRIKLSVDLDGFYKDLYRKRFISEPNLRPIVAVHLRELINGSPDTVAEGRRRVEAAMQNSLFRSVSKEMREPPLDVDLTQADALLETARLEAQRHGVDIIITGTLSINPIKQNELLFDSYEFYDAQLTLSMYRVDNGELLQKVEDRYSAAGEATEAAIGSVLDSMVTRATNQLAATLRGMWDKTMLDKADFRLLIDNLEPTEVTAVMNALKTLDPGMKLYQKAYYGGVLVLNVDSPGVEARQMEKFLRESTQPQFKVEKLDDRHFELRLI